MGLMEFQLKETATSIAPSVTKLFNLSLKSGCFPTLWKLSHVVPIPKSKLHKSIKSLANITTIYLKQRSEHIHTKCIKAKKLIGLLYRRFMVMQTQLHSLNCIYTALVRPHLEYPCEVWNPHLQKERDRLERVQKYGLCMCNKQC